jgi:MFS family permease
MEELTDQTKLKLGAVRREAAFIFIFLTVLLDMLAIGIVIPVLPKLIVDFLGGSAEEGAKMLGIFGTAWALMQFLVSPLQGALSDSFGRRPMILLSNFGVGLDYVLMALAPTLAWLFVGRVISGIAAASVSTAHAYIADVTAPEKRAARFGLLGAAFGAGFCNRAGPRRPRRDDFAPAAVLDCRRPELGQRFLWPFHPPRVFAEKPTLAL